MRLTTCRFTVSLITTAAFAAGLGVGMNFHSGGDAMSAHQSTRLPAESAQTKVLSNAGTRHERLVEALAVMNPALRARQLRSLAFDAMAAGPQAAWAMHLDIAGVADREDYCLEVLRAWTSLDAPAALDAALALTPGRLRTACVAAALEGMAETDAAGALAFAAEKLFGAARENAFSAITRTWASQDPSGAAQWALKNVSIPGASGSLSAAVETWADSDPAAASQWVAGLPPGSPASQAVAALIRSWTEQTPAEAAAWISSQAARASMDAPAAALAAQWAANDPRAASEWASALPRTMTARTAAAQAMGEWAAIAPSDAAAWLAEKAPSMKEIAPALYQSLASGWAAEDPPAAATWVASLTDPWLQRDAAAPLFNTWAATDTGSLTDWISLNHSSPLADAAREQLALNHSDTAPADALAVAFQITAPHQAASLSRQIFENWKSRDLPAARAWASTNPGAASLLDL